MRKHAGRTLAYDRRTLEALHMSDARSDQSAAWRHLYRTARWRKIRSAQLATRPLCELCAQEGRTTVATVCNHVDKASKATEAGFYSGPFSSLCKTCHDGAFQSFENTGSLRGSDASGWPLDPNHHWRDG